MAPWPQGINIYKWEYIKFPQHVSDKLGGVISWLNKRPDPAATTPHDWAFFLGTCDRRATTFLTGLLRTASTWPGVSGARSFIGFYTGQRDGNHVHRFWTGRTGVFPFKIGEQDENGNARISYRRDWTGPLCWSWIFWMKRVRNGNCPVLSRKNGEFTRKVPLVPLFFPRDFRFSSRESYRERVFFTLPRRPLP